MHLYCWLLFSIVSIVCIVSGQYLEQYKKREKFSHKQQSKIGYNKRNIVSNIVSAILFFTTMGQNGHKWKIFPKTIK